jgi:2-oxoglutarate dehydrogenase E1 component
VRAKSLSFNWAEWRPKVSHRLPLPFEKLKNTGIKLDRLKELGERTNTIPKDFSAHPLVRKVYEQRLKTIKDGVGLDWATGEALAWAGLLQEGHTIRLSGQDVQRGTFSHRHAYLHHQEKDETYIPLLHAADKQGFFSANNSSLSELGVLGFEIGYSYADPNSLVLWEGQFGDFADGAQIMIDAYIASGEAKWGVQTGIVLLMPHGYDGQGAEHSSARLERYLQLCDDDPYSCRLPGHLNRDTNWQVVNCTTPANYFHVLRRQIRRDYRKPLIVMSPKRLLRLREVKPIHNIRRLLRPCQSSARRRDSRSSSQRWTSP